MLDERLNNDIFQEDVPKDLRKSVCGNIFKIYITQNSV